MSNTVAARDAVIAVSKNDDAVLIALIDAVLSGRADTEDAITYTDASVAEGARECAAIRGIIGMQVWTARGMQAKAALYKAIPSDALADDIADDILTFSWPV